MTKIMLLKLLLDLPTFDREDTFGWSGNDSRMVKQPQTLGEAVGQRVAGGWVSVDHLVAILRSEVAK